MADNQKFVPRHTRSFIACHWLNCISFMMLYLTALPLYADSFHFMYDIFSPHTYQLAHRFFAVIFVATPIIGIFIANEGFSTLFREVLSFGKADIIFNQKFPVELIGKHPEGIPKQSFYNGGEKMNIAAQAGIWAVLAVTGVLLWFGGEWGISNSVLTWMIPLHSIAAGLGFAAAIGHIYLALVINPDSMRGMKKGSIAMHYAAAHHGKWVDDLVKDGKLNKKDVEAALNRK